MMQKQTGAALIIVLFVVALAASLAVKMNARLMVEVQRSSNLVLQQQARWYAMAGEALAKRLLIDVKKQDKDRIDLSQKWAVETPPYPVEDGTVEGKIIDLQACLNLNALRFVDPNNASTRNFNEAHKTLEALLDIIPDLPMEESKEALADSVFDWLDEDSMPKRQGVEEGEYMSYSIPYMTANNLFASVSELRLIRGFNPIIVEKLKPYVCVIPQYDEFKVNVNTLQPEQSLLLAAMLDISESQAETIISQRPNEGWDDLNKFINDAKQNGAKSLDDKDKRFVINSNYFEAQIKASFFETNFAMKSIIHITDNQKVSVLARRFGGVQ
ncbi:putative type II secretion system protein K [Pseudoalteromonas sp. P1-9]|uniref:type II secretion system minor pseudopilin GspK n=1 Tax=Pseudoalteromonas sp. P1-9 TaxID=1710354 RepID=UPI0006D647BB|nr:type II secretion system minor pseudopilin GspK [Pseudoalteromonas sp. P1-9]KPV96869.1 putative type II secretion system protein K [Pseudoalteromonas sp. P1-9]